MNASSLRAGATRACRRLAVAAAVVAGTVVMSGCAASPYQRVSCTSHSRQSIFVLEAQAVPSATLMPCTNPLPGGWSVGGFEVRSGLARFWLDSDRAGARAAEIRVLPQPRLKLSDPLAGLRQLRPCLLQRGQRIRQLTAQRCRQPGQHLRRRPFITGHTGTLPARECSPRAFPVTRRAPASPCTATPGQTDAAAASARLLPRGDSTFPGAARHAILDPLRHRYQAGEAPSPMQPAEGGKPCPPQNRARNPETAGRAGRSGAARVPGQRGSTVPAAAATLRTRS
jgi:hypothetical protein